MWIDHRGMVGQLSDESAIMCPLMRLVSLAIILTVAGCGGGGSDTPVEGDGSGTASDETSAPPLPPLMRHVTDQPDVYPNEYQVHVIYAVPQDGVDNELDVNRIIAGTITVSNEFFSTASGGKTIRYDLTTDGELDVTFLSLPDRDGSYAANGAFAREAIQEDVLAAGFTDSRKIYLVYYDGTNSTACGGAPPLDTGDPVAVLYLKGAVPGSVPCANNPLARAGGPAGYWEWAAAHEIVHALGYVDACAPNYEATRPAHVGDDPSDLMYAGSAPWNPTTVDPGQDDYYGANLPVECPRNLFFSAFLEPRDGTELPPNF